MKTTVRILTVAALLLAAGATFAHPLDGQVPKFRQAPMVEMTMQGQTYYGHDEESTVYNIGTLGGEPGQPITYPAYYQGNYVADDFADRSHMPVVHVQWWGSYMNIEPGITPTIPIEKFLITFEKDVAVDDSTNRYDFSHPGEPILSQVVTLGELSPGSGTFKEQSIHLGGPPMNEELFVYNAELTCPFEQEPDTVYWLKIAAMVDVEDFDNDGDVDVTDRLLAPRWGWHNRDYTQRDTLASTPSAVNPGEYLDGTLGDGTKVWHFQDDAVSNAREYGPYSGLKVMVNKPDEPCNVEVNQLLSPDPPNIPDFVDQYYLAGIDGPSEISRYSKDLAFALYAPVPEPSTIVLIGMAAVCLLLTRWRSRG